MAFPHLLFASSIKSSPLSTPQRSQALTNCTLKWLASTAMLNDTQSLVSPEVNTASIQLPSPWLSNMVAWFHSVDAQLHCSRITQELTMYFHVLRMLPETMMPKLGKLLSSPLSSTPYTGLKAELLKLISLYDKHATRLFPETWNSAIPNPQTFCPASRT